MTHCKSCGAPLTSNKCKYCGTVYKNENEPITLYMDGAKVAKIIGQYVLSDNKPKCKNYYKDV